jgi:single-strand DNA-binding protein
MSYQLVIVEGNLAADAEVKQLPSKQWVANFRVLVNEEYPGKNPGEMINHVESFRFSLFGPLAHALGPYLKKGKNVLVESRKRTRSYKQGEETKYVEEFLVRDVKLLGARRNESQNEGIRQDVAPADSGTSGATGEVLVDPMKISF